MRKTTALLLSILMCLSSLPVFAEDDFHSNALKKSRETYKEYLDIALEELKENNIDINSVDNDKITNFIEMNLEGETKNIVVYIPKKDSSERYNIIFEVGNSRHTLLKNMPLFDVSESLYNGEMDKCIKESNLGEPDEAEALSIAEPMSLRGFLLTYGEEKYVIPIKYGQICFDENYPEEADKVNNALPEIGKVYKEDECLEMLKAAQTKYDEYVKIVGWQGLKFTDAQESNEEKELDASDKASILNHKGLFFGTDNGFELERPLTRAEGTAMVIRLMGKEDEAANSDYSPHFSDVSAADWSYKYVMYAYCNNIVMGTSESTFTPNRPMSAEEFTALVMRAMGHTETNPDNALSAAEQNHLLPPGYANILGEKNEFLRSDMIDIAYAAYVYGII